MQQRGLLILAPTITQTAQLILQMDHRNIANRGLWDEACIETTSMYPDDHAQLFESSRTLRIVNRKTYETYALELGQQVTRVGGFGKLSKQEKGTLLAHFACFLAGASMLVTMEASNPLPVLEGLLNSGSISEDARHFSLCILRLMPMFNMFPGLCGYAKTMLTKLGHLQSTSFYNTESDATFDRLRDRYNNVMIMNNLQTWTVTADGKLFEDASITAAALSAMEEPVADPA